MDEQEPKSFAEFEEKDWKNFVIYVTFLGIFLIGFGVYRANITVLSLGAVFAGIGIMGGFVLHTVFGIPIVNLRKDVRHTEE